MKILHDLCAKRLRGSISKRGIFASCTSSRMLRAETRGTDLRA